MSYISAKELRLPSSRPGSYDGLDLFGKRIKHLFFDFRCYSRNWRKISSDKNTNNNQESKKIVDNVAFSWIGPVFFVQLGTQIAFEQSILVSVIPQIIALTLGLLIVQIFSAGLAARYTGNFAWYESIMIGFGMLGCAELAFVVMDIGYVQTQIITTDVFVTLMGTTFFLNVAVPILIAWWKPYFVGEKVLKIGNEGSAIYFSKPPEANLNRL